MVISTRQVAVEQTSRIGSRSQRRPTRRHLNGERRTPSSHSYARIRGLRIRGRGRKKRGRMPSGPQARAGGHPGRHYRCNVQGVELGRVAQRSPAASRECCEVRAMADPICIRRRADWRVLGNSPSQVPAVASSRESPTQESRCLDPGQHQPSVARFTAPTTWLKIANSSADPRFCRQTHILRFSTSLARRAPLARPQVDALCTRNFDSARVVFGQKRLRPWSSALHRGGA